ncbi:isochorismatase family protein [Nocardioides sp. LHG3406-4]|uniref:isochorismatase family protein n=1 Tax=Nocardioides sp. LHG3406-4 TaxID=2804575 RepID=UPI003CEFC87C
MSVDPFIQGYDELREQYAATGLGGRMGFGARPAIVVVDLIKGFTSATSPFGSDLDAQVHATNQLLALARERDIPVIFSTIVYDPSLRDAGLWVRKITSNKWLVEDSEWIELDPRLDRRPGETVVVKKYASCFFGTDLVSQLQALAVDTVVITGCTTSGCVRATAVDACSSGLHTIVVEEAVGDRARLPHLAALFDIDAKYGDVLPLAEALANLRGLTERTSPTRPSRSLAGSDSPSPIP